MMDHTMNQFIELFDKLYLIDYCELNNNTEVSDALAGLGILSTGSIAEGCSLPRVIANGGHELDFMIIHRLKENETVEDVSEKPGYVYVLSVGTNGTRVYLSPLRERTMVPCGIMFGMGSLLLSILDTDSSCNINGKYTNASLQCDVEKVKDGRITGYSFDIVQSRIIPIWPNIAREWISRPRKWPSSDDVTYITTIGCHIVPKSSPWGAIHKEWRYSFSWAELQLVRLQSQKQRRAYLLLKYLFYVFIKIDTPTHINAESTQKTTQLSSKGDPKHSVTKKKYEDGVQFCPPVNIPTWITTKGAHRADNVGAECPETDNTDTECEKHELHSYSIKTIWMWYCEQHPPTDDVWGDENIENLIKELLLSYREFLSQGCIPNYFIPEQNVIDGVSSEILEEFISRVQSILDNFLKYVKWTLKDFADDKVKRAIEQHSQGGTSELNTLKFELERCLGLYPIGDPDVDD